MFAFKRYSIFQNYKGVAQKLGLPHPFEFQNSKGRGRHNFWATTLKLWKNGYLLRMFKSYYYHFSIFLLDSDLEKTPFSQTSIAWGVSDVHSLRRPWFNCENSWKGVSIMTRYPNYLTIFYSQNDLHLQKPFSDLKSSVSFMISFFQ